MQYLRTASKKSSGKTSVPGVVRLPTPSRRFPSDKRNHECDTLFGLDIGVGIAEQVTPAITIGIQLEKLKGLHGKDSRKGIERVRNPRASQCR